jgi:rare lipoprotein A
MFFIIWERASRMPNVRSLPLACSVLLLSFASACSHAPRIGESFVERGEASWYGPGFQGRRTASGEIYDSHLYTAAHRSLPFGMKVLVKNLKNGKTVIVRINDRGPAVRSRLIDLSRAAAQQLGFLQDGTCRVEIRND